MTENKNNPKIRFPGFTDAWEQRKLSELFEERHAFTKITDKYPRLSFTIDEGVISPEDRKTNKRDFLMKDEANKKFLITEVGDIIYNPANVVFGAIHRNSLRNGCLSPIYRIFVTQQDSRFMECVVRSPLFISKLAQRTEGSVVKLKTLKPEAFLNMDVNIAPTIGEQEKIADFIYSIDNLITLHQRKYEAIKDYKQGILQKMFPKEGKNVPEIRFPGFTDAWEQRKLESLCDVFTDGDWIEAKDQSNSGVRLVQTGNVGNTEYLDKENNKKWISDETFERLHCKEIYAGDILISRLPDPAGRACIMPDLGTRMITAVDCTIVRTSKDYDSKYLVQYLSTPMYFKVVNSFLGGGTRQRISRGNLSGIDIPIPSTIEEQKKIGDFFANLDNLITLHQRKCEELKEYKNGLLQKMFV